MSNNLFEAVDKAFEEGRIILTEDKELKYSYSNDEIRSYMEKDKESNMSDMGMSEEEFEEAVNEGLKNIDHIESSEPITTIGQIGASDFQGFNGGTVITYLTNGRKFIWEEGDESDISIWNAVELVLSNEISNDSEEDAVGFDKERELEKLHQYDESENTADDIYYTISEFLHISPEEAEENIENMKHRLDELNLEPDKYFELLKQYQEEGKDIHDVLDDYEFRDID